MALGPDKCIHTSTGLIMTLSMVYGMDAEIATYTYLN